MEKEIYKKIIKCLNSIEKLLKEFEFKCSWHSVSNYGIHYKTGKGNYGKK